MAPEVAVDVTDIDVPIHECKFEAELQRVVFTRVVRKVCGKVTESLGGPLGLVQAGRGSSEREGRPAGQQFDVSRGSPVYVVVV